ncbi:MAG: sigma 54-interacting transcriptional regulator [Bacteroidota bacterium]
MSYYLQEEPGQTEKHLKESLQFETLLSQISTEFITLKLWQIDKGIQKAIGQLGVFMKVDRVYITLYSDDKTTVSETHTWTAHGISQTGPNYQNIETKNFQWTMSQMQKNRVLLVEDIEDLPEQGKKEIAHLLKADNTKSTICVPITFEGETLGLIGFDECHSIREWPHEIINRLRLVGEIFANALNRKKSEEALQKAYQEIAILKDRLQAENIYLKEEIKANHNHDKIIGSKKGLKEAMFQVEQVAPTDSTVLILGETGTGKELIAHAIHDLSNRKNGPLIKLNCAALPSTLIESELFGHEKGAFTGAQSKRIGRFELANKGTLFLDEIGELPLDLQVKLLRVLQEGELERIGSPNTIKIDVRIIAATNRNLAEAINKKQFRSDLYYRIFVFPIQVPPLRKRKEDIPDLVQFFLQKTAKKVGKPIPTVNSHAIQKLQAYSWPGNVRELENVIERALILNTGDSLQIGNGYIEFFQSGLSVGVQEDQSLETVERNHILEVLEECQWKIEGTNGAASILKIHPSTLRSRMKKLGISK